MHKENKRKRQTNIELFRIVTMFMIVTIHFLVHGGVVDATEPFSMKYYILWTLCAICYVSVNGYVLISGYFQCESQFKLKKLIILLIETWLYSVVIFIALYATSNVKLNLKNLCIVLFPTLNRAYWFVTVYVGMYILSPFLNWVLKRINKKQHFLLLTVLILMFSVWPTFAYLSTGLNFGGSFGVVWFVVLYCIGAYIRKYYGIKGKWMKLFGLYLVFALSVPLSKFILVKFSEITSSKFFPDDMFFDYNSVLVLTASILLFLVFLNIEIKNTVVNKIITFLAPATLGVYLIHDNPFVREWIWDYLKMNEYVQSKYFYLIMIGTIFGLYLGCTILEKLRAAAFKRIDNSRQLNKWCRRTEKYFSRLYHCMGEE